MKVDSSVAREVSDAHGLPMRIARILCTRVTPEEVSFWLRPDLIPYQAPELFLDMTAAVERIRVALKERQRIAVVGDYDVDGVTATTILATTLQALGGDFLCYIPHRVDDGYGLSEALVDRAIAGGCELLVTVDNGIRANQAITYAIRHGVDVVVTDHHEPSDELPFDATAIVHFVRSQHHELSVLSGAGVAWKLASALLEGTETVALRQWHLGLAALGALADIMPMKGENRRLVKEGIEALKFCARPGWLALCRIAGVSLEKLTDTSILWSITPRLNAAGRMGSAETALRLLLASDDATAMVLADEVEAANTERRRATTEAVAHAEITLKGLHQGDELPPVMVVAGPWPLGVVGIVAAKLADTYGRPALVFADDGSDVLRGSGRSPDGVPFHDAVSRCAHLLEHFGGHSTALGCGVARSNLEAFQTELQTALLQCRTLQPDSLLPGEDELSTIADDYLPISEANLEMAEWLTHLGPYGPGYAPYRFYIGPVELTDIASMGAGKHLRLVVREGRHTAKLIWFSPPAWAFGMAQGSILAAVVALEVNTWQGRDQAQLRILEGSVLAKPILREDFAQIYRLLQARRKLMLSDVSAEFGRNTTLPVQTIFDTFVDLGFAYLEESAYHVVEQAEAQDLRESVVYQTHLREAAARSKAMGQ